MPKNKAQQDLVKNLLQKAAIDINGEKAQDIHVKDERLYSRIIAEGSLGVGESYMDGWWDSAQLDQTITQILQANLADNLNLSFKTIMGYIGAYISNHGSRRRSFEIGKKHYDTGNDLFTAMLDKRLVYTCAYWKNAQTLDEAQEAKLDLVCRKLNLQAGQRVLDIGCGWGSFAKFAAEKYGVSVVGVTVSKEQAELGAHLCSGLPVEIRLQDYRDVAEKFDHIVSLGMFEHVGTRNYKTYMETAHRCLADNGLFLLHTIGGNHSVHHGDAWIEKYIFPGGMLPSVAQIGKSIEGLFVMEDWHNFGPDYDKTLLAWFANFDRNWPTLKEKYGERFYRMWKFYLLSCAGAFRARKIQLWQVVLSKNGISGGYTSIR